jgi:hypothetical protein
LVLADAGGQAGTVFAGLDDVTRSSLQIFLSGEAPDALQKFNTELGNSGDYAKNAAATMGGSLGAAFDALMSTVGAAANQFATPILKPLKDGAGELTQALGTLVNNRFLETLGNSLSELASAGVASLKRLFTGFDGKEMQASLTTLVEGAKQKGLELIRDLEATVAVWKSRWTDISASTVIAIEGITQAFQLLKVSAIAVKNGLEMAFSLMAQAIFDKAASISEKMAWLAEKLGATDMAAKLKAQTEALKQNSRDYAAGIEKDAEDMKLAWDNYAQQAAVSGEKIKGAYHQIGQGADESKAKQVGAAQETVAAVSPEYAALQTKLQELQQEYDDLAKMEGTLPLLGPLAAQIGHVGEELNNLASANDKVGVASQQAAEGHKAQSAALKPVGDAARGVARLVVFRHQDKAIEPNILGHWCDPPDTALYSITLRFMEL